MAEEIGQALLNVDVRPVRIAYAAAERSREDFQAAVLEASSRWGGIQEPILPVAGNGRILDEWMGLLNLMPIDFLCTVSDQVQLFSASLQEQVGRQVVPLRSIQQGISALHATAVQPTGRPPSNVIGARVDDPITSLAGLGAAWDQEQVEAWQQAGLSVFPQPFGLAQLVGAQINGTSVIGATGHQCGETLIYNFTDGPVVVWLSEPDSLEDAWEYWNLRTLIPRLSFMPSCLVPVPSEEAGTLRTILDAACKRRPFVSEPDVLVFSRSVEKAAAMEFMGTLGAVDYTGDGFKVSWSGNIIDRSSQPITAVFGNPSRFLATRRDLGQRAVVPTYLRRKKTIISADSPVRFRYLGGGQVRVRFSGHPALAIPHSPSAARLFDPNAVIAQGCVEITTAPATHYTLSLDVPERMAVLSAYLQDRQFGHRLSDKGRLAAGVLNVTPDVAQLRSPVALAVIDALTTHRFSYELKEARKQVPEMREEQLEQLVRSLQDVRQTSRTLEQIFNAVRSTGFQVEREHIGSALGSLVDASMAVRGFLVRCDLCHLKSFTELSAATAPALCPGCRSLANYLPDLAGEPAILYRLNALVDRASDNGVLGHVVAEAALHEMFGEQDIVNLPGADLTLPDGTSKEADLLALAGADVWLGEVKPQSASFTDEQLDRDLDLAEQVGATTYLVACLNGIEPSRVDAALARALSRNIQLATLESADGAIRMLSSADLPHTPPSTAPPAT